MQSYSFLEPNWIFLFVYLLFCFAFFLLLLFICCLIVQSSGNNLVNLVNLNKSAKQRESRMSTCSFI